MQNNLLIISCSQRKVRSPGLIPAIDLYDGPTCQIHAGIVDAFKSKNWNLLISRISTSPRCYQISLGIETSNRKRFYTEMAGPQKPYIGETPTTSGVATTTTLKRRSHNGRTTQENHSNTR